MAAKSGRKAGTALAVTADIGVPAIFDPAKSKVRVGKADAIIALAKKIKDWPLLEKAVDAKIEEQAQFVAWWAGHVRGKGKPKKKKNNNADSALINVPDAEKKTEITQQQQSRWRNRLKDRPGYRGMLLKAPWRVAYESAAQLNQQSLSNEHYTPPEYIEAARAVLGEIDTDPATCAKANETVQAKTAFTQADKVCWIGPGDAPARRWQRSRDRVAPGHRVEQGGRPDPLSVSLPSMRVQPIRSVRHDV